MSGPLGVPILGQLPSNGERIQDHYGSGPSKVPQRLGVRVGKSLNAPETLPRDAQVSLESGFFPLGSFLLFR